MLKYNPGKLLKELQAEGLAVDGVDSNGNISWVNYKTDDNGNTPEIPDNLKIHAGAILKEHDPTPEKEIVSFEQEFLVQTIKLDQLDGKDRMKKLSALFKDPLIGAFILPCLNASGKFDPSLIEALKTHILNEPSLGEDFWNQLSEVYARVKNG